MALNQQQTTTQLTVNHVTDIKTPHRGIQLLPTGLVASDFTAKPISFGFSNGLTVYNYTLYEKKENKKIVARHFNGFEPVTREKSRALI